MTQPLPQADELARTVIDDVTHGRWADVTSRFDATMREGLTDEQLAGAWAQLVGSAGAYESHGDTISTRDRDFTVTNTPLTFAAGTLVARITFRDDQTIAGLYFLDPAVAGDGGDPLPQAKELAEAVIDDLTHARWPAVRQRFDATMSAGLSEESLVDGWTQTVGAAGAYQSHGDTAVVRAGEFTVTNTPLAFETGEFVARISFRDDETIAGLYFLNP